MLPHNCTTDEMITALRKHADTVRRALDGGPEQALARDQLLGGSEQACRMAADRLADLNRTDAIRQAREALALVGPALSSAMNEVVGKGVTDWGLVNDCLCKASDALLSMREG